MLAQDRANSACYPFELPLVCKVPEPPAGRLDGSYILEAMNTGPLAADKAYEFLFVLGQARIRGAVQMIVNPVAIR